MRFLAGFGALAWHDRRRVVSTCLSLLLAAAGSCWALAGCDANSPTVNEWIKKAQLEGALRVGVFIDQPLVGGYSTKAHPKSVSDFEPGFETELAVQLAAFLGFPKDRITFVPEKSTDRERELQQGNVDVMVASFSITDERKKNVTFIGPYLITTPEALVRRGVNLPNQSFDDLNNLGARLCTEEDTTSASALRAKDVTHFTGVSLAKQCIDGMLSQPAQFDAFMIDEPILAGYLYQYPGKFSMVDLPLNQSEFLGIAVSKENPALADLVANFLQRSYDKKDNGAWQQAWQQTLGRVLSERTQPRVTEPPRFTPLRDGSDRNR